MNTQAMLLLLFILICAIGLPYMIRLNYKTRLRNFQEAGDYDNAFQLLNDRIYRYLFGNFFSLWNLLQLEISHDHPEKAQAVIDELLYGRFSKKEKHYVASHAFFYFVDKEDAAYCKKLLDCLKTTAESDEYLFDEVMYHILVEHNSTKEDAQYLENLLSKVTDNNLNKEQTGIMQYMLGMHYRNQQDKLTSKKHFKAAIPNLKDTPYYVKAKIYS